MKKIFGALLIASITIIACNDNEAKKSVAGDAYMVSQLVGQDTLFGISIHAYSLYPMSSVIVTPENDNENSYSLQSYPGFKTDFYYDTPASQLSKQKPATGNYHFEARFETGEYHTDDDILGSEVLFPPKVETCSYDATKKQALIEWKTVTGADVYVVKLYKQDTLVFLSAAIPPEYKKVAFDANSSSWGKDFIPKAGTNFQARISAFKYEAGGDNFNVQASTSSDATLIWGNN